MCRLIVKVSNTVIRKEKMKIGFSEVVRYILGCGPESSLSKKEEKSVHFLRIKACLTLQTDL